MKASRRFCASGLLSVGLLGSVAVLSTPASAITSSAPSGVPVSANPEIDQLVGRSMSLATSDARLEVHAVDAATGRRVDGELEYEMYVFDPAQTSESSARLLSAGSTRSDNAIALPSRAEVPASLVDGDGRVFVVVMARGEGRVGFSTETLYSVDSKGSGLWSTNGDPQVRSAMASLSAADAGAIMSERYSPAVEDKAQSVSMDAESLRELIVPQVEVVMSPYSGAATKALGFGGGVTNFPAPCDFLYDRQTTNHDAVWTTIMNAKSNGHTKVGFNYSSSSGTIVKAGYSLTGSSSGFTVSGQTSNSQTWGFGNTALPTGTAYKIQLRGNYRTKKWECVPTNPAQSPYNIWERYLYVWNNGSFGTPTTTTQPPSCGTYNNWGAVGTYAWKDVSTEKSGGAGASISGLTMSSTTSHSTSTNMKFTENGSPLGGGICSNWATAAYVNVK